MGCSSQLRNVALPELLPPLDASLSMNSSSPCRCSWTMIWACIISSSMMMGKWGLWIEIRLGFTPGGLSTLECGCLPSLTFGSCPTTKFCLGLSVQVGIHMPAALPLHQLHLSTKGWLGLGSRVFAMPTILPYPEVRLPHGPWLKCINRAHLRSLSIITQLTGFLLSAIFHASSTFTSVSTAHCSKPPPSMWCLTVALDVMDDHAHMLVHIVHCIIPHPNSDTLGLNSAFKIYARQLRLLQDT